MVNSFHKLLLIGIALLLFFNLLDCVDGSIARATGTQNPYGKFLDSVLGDTVNFAFFGVVGRIAPHKGQDVFILAIPRILNFFPNSTFAIVGEDTTSNGDFIIQLQQLTAELRLETKVYFSGFKANVPQIMKAIDILVVPSLVEAFGRVAIEAMAMKTPVVASRVGGIPDIIEDGVNGILVPLKDPKAISEAVIKLLSDKDLYYNISQNSRKTVEELFSIPKHVEKVEKLYQSLISL